MNADYRRLFSVVYSLSEAELGFTAKDEPPAPPLGADLAPWELADALTSSTVTVPNPPRWSARYSATPTARHDAARYGDGVSSWRVRSAERAAAQAKRAVAEARRQHERALRKQARALEDKAAAARRKRSKVTSQQASLDRDEARSRRGSTTSGRRGSALPSPWKRRQIKRRLRDELRQAERELRSATEKRRSVLSRLRNRRY
jgi:hypothetical protein